MFDNTVSIEERIALAISCLNHWGHSSYEEWENVESAFNGLNIWGQEKVFDLLEEDHLVFPDTSRFNWGVGPFGREQKEYFCSTYYRGGRWDGYHYGWVA